MVSLHTTLYHERDVSTPIGSCIENEPRATVGSPVVPALRWSAGAINNAEIHRSRLG